MPHRTAAQLIGSQAAVAINPIHPDKLTTHITPEPTAIRERRSTRLRHPLPHRRMRHPARRGHRQPIKDCCKHPREHTGRGTRPVLLLNTLLAGSLGFGITTAYETIRRLTARNNDPLFWRYAVRHRQELLCNRRSGCFRKVRSWGVRLGVVESPAGVPDRCSVEGRRVRVG